DSTFNAKTTYVTGVAPNAVTVGLLNADTLPDAVVANLADNTVSVFFDGTGAVLQPKTDYPAAMGPFALASADMDGDAKADVGVVNAPTVSVFLTNGDGTLAPKADYPRGNGPLTVGVANLNADTSPDAVVANGNDNTVSVFLNNGNGTLAAKVDYP